MALFPGVQRKAQDELDRVVGRDRLPKFSDLADMTYIRAVAMETMRWMPPFPMGVPHVVMEDDVYDGMFVPKGSTMIPVSRLPFPDNATCLLTQFSCRISGVYFL